MPGVLDRVLGCRFRWVFGFGFMNGWVRGLIYRLVWYLVGDWGFELGFRLSIGLGLYYKLGKGGLSVGWFGT